VHKNLVVLGIGSTLAIAFGFVIASMIDRERRGESFPHPRARSAIGTSSA
jgi:glucose/mannose transport system permease protein